MRLSVRVSMSAKRFPSITVKVLALGLEDQQDD